MPKIAGSLAAAILIALATSYIHPAAAQDRIRIAWAGDSPANSPIWVVQEKGLLKKQGLTPEVIRSEERRVGKECRL